MAGKKRKVTRRRKARPIVVQLPKRNPRRKMPKRGPGGRFVKARTRSYRRNPVPALGAGALVVNPRRKPRKYRRNPGPIKAVVGTVKKALKSTVLIPLMIGGAIGVVAMAAIDRYIMPRIGKWGTVGKFAAGLVMVPALNKVVKNAGFYAGGFMIGSALKDWILGWLPWGKSPAAIAGLGNTEWLGEAAGDGDDDGDDGGVDDVLAGADGDMVVDGLGILPPFPVRAPRGLIRGLRRRRLAWLLRLLSAEQIQELMSKPLPQRKRAIRELRQLYQQRRSQVDDQRGRRYERHPAVQAHPMRRPHRPGGVRPGMQRGGMQRGGRPGMRRAALMGAA